MKKALIALLAVVLLSGCVTVRHVEAPGSGYDFVAAGGTIVRTKKSSGEAWILFRGYWLPVQEAVPAPEVPGAEIR